MTLIFENSEETDPKDTMVPQPIERLNEVGVIQIECKAQFSLSLTKFGHGER